MNSDVSARDREMAQLCIDCTICSNARKKQRGLAFMFVRLIEGKLCPACRAYDRVYGRKAHEPISS